MRLSKEVNPAGPVPINRPLWLICSAAGPVPALACDVSYALCWATASDGSPSSMEEGNVHASLPVTFLSAPGVLLAGWHIMHLRIAS